jgi:hypothetical protein
MIGRICFVFFLALAPLVDCHAQESKAVKLERVIIAEEMRKPGFVPSLLVGKTFNARDGGYDSLGRDPKRVFIPYIFDEDTTRVCLVALGRKLSGEEKANVLSEEQRNDSLIVDAIVINKKKQFAVVDHLLTLPAGGRLWVAVGNMFGISEYNKPQEIEYDRYIIPDFMFRFGNGSDKIQRVTNFDGRVYRDSSFR